MPTIPILADNSSAPSALYWVAVVLVAAGLGLIVLVLMGIRRGQLPFGVPEGHATGSFDGPGSTTQEAERLLRLMGEAEEVCTRLGRDLDDKAARIERLLARAEGMFGDAAAAGRSGGGGAPSMNGSSDGLYMPPTSSGYPTRPEIVTRPVGVPTGVAQQQPAMYGAPAAYPAQRTPQHAQPSPAQAVLGPQPMGGMGGTGGSNDPEALAQQIFRLADAGLSPGEIAQRLGQHTGKVELIIALRNT